MHSEDTVLEVARRYAEALAADDFDTAAKLIAGAAVYAFRGRRIMGRDKIVDSFSTSAEWTAQTFDSIAQQSSEKVVSETVARVHFVDQVRCGQHSLEHRSEQVIEIDPEREIITHITHVDLPGETQKLDIFLRQCGAK